jgi:phosphoribosylamine--glycine ligase
MENKTDILVIGGGGREHAIVKCLLLSKRVNKVFCAPANGGISEDATCVDIKTDEFDKILEFLKQNKSIGLTFVAPDNPLADGLVNLLNENGFRAFGPSKEAAEIEGSKIFSKAFMKQFNIPTAGYAAFVSYDEAVRYIENHKFPCVIKADGLAFGKGVIIANDKPAALGALKEIMLDGAHGKSNTKVVIEEFLVGREVTVLAFTDGETVVTMPSAQDHKRAYDNDEGLNTGGMGAFAKSPYFCDSLYQKTLKTIIMPTIKGMAEIGRKFKGVIYFGLMICGDTPYVIEYNARFGDPETQVVLPLLKTDLLDIIDAVIDEKLHLINVEWKDETAVTVVLASGGYPSSYQKGKEITIGDTEGLTVYHAGTEMKNGKLVTNGGRVFAVTALGKNIADARAKVYNKINNIKFEGMFFRKDIGLK